MNLTASVALLGATFLEQAAFAVKGSPTHEVGVALGADPEVGLVADARASASSVSARPADAPSAHRALASASALLSG